MTYLEHLESLEQEAGLMEGMEKRDGLSAARGCLLAVAAGAVIWVVLGGLAWLGWSLWHTPHPQSVPQAVYTDGTTKPAPDVTTWAQDELDTIGKEWTIPPHTLVVVSPLSWNGITVISEKPVRYTVVLVRWAYPDEAQVKFTTAHEAGHLLQSEAGLPQSEAVSDQFALCFGSPKAQEYAKTDRHVTADCDQLRRTLTSGRP